MIIFAPGNDGELKGSGRSINGFHLRDALDLVSKQHPGLLRKFGGHAAAAGLTIQNNDFDAFHEAFEQVAQTLLTPADLTRVIETDGDLELGDIKLELAETLERQVWGQGFPQPSFTARFYVESQRIVGEKHLKLKLRKLHAASAADAAQAVRKSTETYDGILFFHNDPLPDVIDAVYRLQINEYNGKSSLQFLLEHCFHADNPVTGDAH